uniref:Uncharacterized protein n=1 Tax=Anguilla anguilla TaxID=7936 RepID=A0A0E9WG22_ANGAN
MPKTLKTSSRSSCAKLILSSLLFSVLK